MHVSSSSELIAGVGGGVIPELICVVCGSLPKTLTLFKTKICDFFYSIISFLVQSDINYLKALWSAFC